MSKAWWLVVVTCALGCGSSSSTKVDAGTTDGKPADSKPIDGPAHVFMDGPPGTTPLKVKNYLSWCTVTVNGGTPSAGAQQLVNVDPGTIDLSATANTGFKLGLWHHTDGDSGSGDPGTVVTGTSSTTVTVGATATCVWVCCPFTDGTGCPTADQCP